MKYKHITFRVITMKYILYTRMHFDIIIGLLIFRTIIWKHKCLNTFCVIFLLCLQVVFCSSWVEYNFISLCFWSSEPLWPTSECRQPLAIKANFVTMKYKHLYQKNQIGLTSYIHKRHNINYLPISTIHVTKNIWIQLNEVWSNKGSRPFPWRDNNELA